MAKKIRQKELATLRTKDLANGNKSLYLDIYYNGTRKYEFLKLYLLPGSDAVTRRKNANTLTVAQELQAKRIADIQRDMVEGKKMILQDISLIDYIYEARDKAVHKKQNSLRAYNITASSLKKYCIAHREGRDINLTDVDHDLIISFRDYLRTTGNTESTIFTKLGIVNMMMKAALLDKLILSNPFTELRPHEKVKKITREVCYLTKEELDKLLATPVKPMIRNMFELSCYTGLRISDIKDLKWSNIITDGSRKYIDKAMVKTGARIVLPLNRRAAEIIAAQPRTQPTVFRNFGYPDMCKKMEDWSQAADLGKTVTFHVARHTFATLALTLGADLYTVSDLLGHANIKTTQVYAKIVDSKKSDAMNLFDNI